MGGFIVVKIKQDLLPTSASNRPGTKINPTYVTVHETANISTGANAEMHARYIKGQDARNRQVSWHITVDDAQAIQHLPFNEKGWHAGNGNGVSIGVELCVNADGDFAKTRANAVQIIRDLQKKYNIPDSRVVSHKFWTGKNCPTNLLKVWSSFKAELSGAKVSKPKQTQTGSTQVKSISAMADEVIAGKHGSGHENRRKSLGISKSEYEKVRAEVNRRSGTTASKPKPKPTKTVAQMAQEVINGRHGSGHTNRRNSLGISQAQYNKVRAEVNRRASGGGSSSSGKSISQMATEVIQGKHGSGHANRRKSLGISQSQYNKVRAEVNKRL